MLILGPSFLRTHLLFPFHVGQQRLRAQPNQTRRGQQPQASRSSRVLWKFKGVEISALVNLFCAKNLASKDEPFVISCSTERHSGDEQCKTRKRCLLPKACGSLLPVYVSRRLALLAPTTYKAEQWSPQWIPLGASQCFRKGPFEDSSLNSRSQQEQPPGPRAERFPSPSFLQVRRKGKSGEEKGIWRIWLRTFIRFWSEKESSPQHEGYSAKILSPSVCINNSPVALFFDRKTVRDDAMTGNPERLLSSRILNFSFSPITSFMGTINCNLSPKC